MDMEYTNMTRVIFTKDSGLMVRDMGPGQCYTPTFLYIKDSGTTMNNMAMVCARGTLESSPEIIHKERGMGREHGKILLGLLRLENGITMSMFNHHLKIPTVAEDVV
jgi:hypothetical protein